MPSKSPALIALCLLAGLMSSACAVKAATIGTSVIVCGTSMVLPNVLPPDDSGTVVLMAVPCFETNGTRASIPEAYRRYIHLQPSRPLAGVWVPYDENAQKTIEADYRRLWDTGRLSDLSISVTDYLFQNGVVGKFVTFTIREQ